MTISGKREALTLFLGDIMAFVAALWLTLFLRYREIPSGELFQSHLIPFSFIFLIWVLTFFIAGLYEKHTTLMKSRLPLILLNAQIVNSVVAVVFFYLIPYFGINPKTNLFIYIIISSSFILIWRSYVTSALGFKNRERAILVGEGEEMEELKEEVNSNPKYSIYFVSSVNVNNLDNVDFKREIMDTIQNERISSIVIDLKSKKIVPILPELYNMIFSNVKFIDMYQVYEDTFDRIPLSLLNYDWFLENISRETHSGYDILKRVMDTGAAFMLGLISLVVYPFVYIAIKLEDGGPVFITQERIGRGNKIIKLIKFRSMNVSDTGVWPKEKDNRVTKVGKVIRNTRIDELPQLWSVINGDISLIGPRPDIIDLGKKLASDIPYYTVRNLIKPGLSGWAQIKQELPPHSVEETKTRLSYDLYYLKNRSLMLDLKIALQTVKTLLSRTGK